MNKLQVSKIGFIGFGEVAGILIRGFQENGIKNIYVYEKLFEFPEYKEELVAKANKLNVNLVDNINVIGSEVDLVFVTVPATKTEEVYESIKGSLKEKQLYVDLTSSSPTIKQKIANKMENESNQFIDGTIMGPVISEGYKVPIFLSGENALELEGILNDLNMNTKYISQQVGSSSAIKLIRSIYMKGISSLMLEMLLASESYNVSKEVISSLSGTLDNTSFEETLNRLITGNAIHAERRAAELDGSIDLLESISIGNEMTKATQSKLNQIVDRKLKEEFSNERPETWKAVIEKLK